MKKAILLTVFSLLLIFFPKKGFACDEASAVIVSSVDNGNGTFTFVLDVCVEYLGLEGSPDEWTFEFAGATIQSFLPPSVTTGTGDLYTGSIIGGGSTLEYATNEIFPSHTGTTFCNTYTITTLGSPTAINIDYHVGFPGCQTTLGVCAANAGTLTTTINGVPQGNPPYNVPDGGTIVFTSNNDFIPPPPAGADPAGIAFAIFGCDPSGLDLNDPNTYTGPGVNPNCFLGFDFNSSTGDVNTGGASTSPPGYTSLWLVVITVDDADCNGQTPCNGGIDLNGDGCVANAGSFQIIYDPPCTPPTAVAMNGGPYCSGDPISLMAQTVTGATYNWTGPSGFSSNQQNPTNATQAGAYTLIVSAGGCDSNPAPTIVVINLSLIHI